MSSSRNFRSVPPPSNLNSRQSYSRFEDVDAKASTARVQFEMKLKSKRAKSFPTDDDDDDYFERDDDNDRGDNVASGQANDSEEEDPLDAFMADLNKEISKKPNTKTNDSSSTLKMSAKKDASKGIRQDIEDADHEESYYRYMEANPNAGMGTLPLDSDEENPTLADSVEYDADGNPIAPTGKKMIDPLPVIYHSQIDYAAFEKNFYTEHEDIKRLTNAEVGELRQKQGIRVSGPQPPKPCSSFAHFGFDEALMKVIRKLEYTRPTPIQAQAIPAALTGRDIIGIAKTGSGKTAAFIWPLLVHILDQPQLKPGDGPIGLILAPTRELSQQIYTEAKRFAKPYGIHIVCAYGGGSKYEQSKDLEQGADILVGTPGRVIDFVKMKATNLLRVTYLVLDEADRMFDMGFEPQVRSICNHVRPDRQTLMFSATFKKRIEKLARDVLTDPIRIVQGEIGEANQDVHQIVLVFQSATSQKWDWLMEHLIEFTSAGSVLIFVTKKNNAQELAANIASKSNLSPVLLHGDMNQLDRNKVITAFKRQESKVLVATDVAARGLDISHIRTVINFDLALDIDTHTHRVGRTGRAGEQGVAYTLATEKDKEFCGHLVRNLESANQPVPDSLLNLAMQSQWFRKSRFKQGKAKLVDFSIGTNRRARPGLGSSTATPSTSKPVIENTFIPASSSSSANTKQDRISMMRDSYKAQFRSQFSAATDTAWNQKESESRPQKKSRWN